VPVVPLEPVAGVARCVLNGRIAGQACVNVLHIRNTSHGSWVQAEADQVATSLRAFWVTRFLPQQGSAFTFEDVTVTDLTTNVGVVGTMTGSNVGGNAATTLPANCAICVTWQTSRHYRGGHPRTYLAAPVQTGTSDQRHWTNSYATQIQTAARGLRTDIAGIGPGVNGAYALVAVHRIKSKARLVPPLVDDITSATCDLRIDSQRRRLGGAGS
jgi:hypothetical protein